MIKVTRLNGKEFIVNTDMIKTIEATPDSVIRLASEDKFVVRESVDEILSRVVDYRRVCNQVIEVIKEEDPL